MNAPASRFVSPNILVSLALLYFALRGIDFTAIQSRLSHINLGWIALAVLCRTSTNGWNGRFDLFGTVSFIVGGAGGLVWILSSEKTEKIPDALPEVE